MTTLSWRLARTQADLDDAQRLRFQCLVEENRIPLSTGGRIPRDVSAFDSLGTTHHVLVYAGWEPVATARLCLHGGSSSGAGFELEQAFDLRTLASVKWECGEVSRFCVLARCHGTLAVVRLYEGLYLSSKRLGLRYWIGGVDCQTSSEEEARLMRQVLERRGALTSQFAFVPRPDPSASAPGGPHFYSHEERDALSRGGLEAARVAPRLETFTRRLGARCAGHPARHPTFARMVMPMIAELEAIPESTLAHFDRSSVPPSACAPSAVGRNAEAGAAKARVVARTGHADLYGRLLDIARGGVDKLDRHCVAGELMQGTLSADAYAEYLAQVVHYVRGSSPMLARSARALNRAGRARLSDLFQMKAGEEQGHDLWALEDLAALGADRSFLADTPPCPAVRLYSEWTSYVADAAPVAILGVAFVLEWFGYSRAGAAADALIANATIPGIQGAVRFLRGHGEADVHHIQTLAWALDEVSVEEIEAVVLSASVTAASYLGIFEWVASRLGSRDRASVAALPAAS